MAMICRCDDTSLAEVVFRLQILDFGIVWPIDDADTDGEDREFLGCHQNAGGASPSCLDSPLPPPEWLRQ